MTLLQSLVSGTMVGGLYAVMAIGLTLVFGVVRIVNFAHGAFVMLAGYLTWLVHDRLGWDPFVTVAPLFLVFFVLGWIFYLLLLKRLDGANLLSQTLFTIGVAFVIQGGVIALFGPQPHSLQTSYSLETVEVGGLVIPLVRIWAFGVALLMTLTLFLLLRLTDFGRSIRAAATDAAASQLMGVNPTRVKAITTAIGIGCAGVAGAVLVPILSVDPEVGIGYTFSAFLIIILGGLGSFGGAFLGGIAIGITEAVGQTYLDGGTAHALTFVIFILLLLLRPNGLLPRKAV